VRGGGGGEGGSWGHDESQIIPWEKQQQDMHKFMKK